MNDINIFLIIKVDYYKALIDLILEYTVYKYYKCFKRLMVYLNLKILRKTFLVKKFSQKRYWKCKKVENVM